MGQPNWHGGQSRYGSATRRFALPLILMLGGKLTVITACETDNQRRLREMNLTEDQARLILADISAKRAASAAPMSPDVLRQPAAPASSPSAGIPGSPTTKDSAANDSAASDYAASDSAANDSAASDSAANDSAANDSAANDSAASDSAASDSAATTGSGVARPTTGGSTHPTASGPPKPARPSHPASESSARALTQALEPTLVGRYWMIDGLVDVAPAAPSTASQRGVVVLTKDDQVLLAPLSKLSQAPEPAETPVSPLPDDGKSFRVGRGPALDGDSAYWVSTHRLLRARLPSAAEITAGRTTVSKTETLARDARVGTRADVLRVVSDPENPTKDSSWIAYIALPAEKDGPLRAKLWTPNQPTQLLTPSGSSTLSVRLVESNSRRFAVSMEARTGATSLHARELVGFPPKLSEDRVIWVGGAAHPTTELELVRPMDSKSTEVYGLMPLQQDVTHFGIATVRFPAFGRESRAELNWTLFKNGIDPAPVTTSVVCGRKVVLFARPSTSQPRAPQELVLATISNGNFTEEMILARSKAFFDISLASLDSAPQDSSNRAAGDTTSRSPQRPPRKQRGALLSYVADYRTWARSIRCKL